MTIYDALFQASGSRYGVPPTLLEAIARKESSLRPDIDPNPPIDGVGLMQMTMATAQRMGYAGDRDGLKDPAVNIDLGAKYSAAIIQSQGGVLNLPDFYSEYNSGRKDLWRTSTQVANNVAGFLREMAFVLGISIPDGTSIDDALSYLSSVKTESWGGIVLLLGMFLIFKKKKSKK